MGWGLGKAVLATALIWSSTSWSAEYHLGLGLLPYNINETTTERSGEFSYIGDLFYPLQIRGVWDAFETYELYARLAYTLLPNQAVDGAGDLTLGLLSFGTGQNFGSANDWRWSVGLGIFRHQLSGKGGSVQLNNGSGMATFYRPGRDVASQLVTLEGGLGYQFLTEWRSDIELIGMGWLSERFSFSALWSVSYTFGGGL